MKQYNYDNKKFKHLILFIGRDLDYAKSLIDVLISKKKKIKYIFYSNIAEIRIIKQKYNKYKIYFYKNKNELINIINNSSDLLGINCGYSKIIPNKILEKIPIINIHPSYLPYNKGSHHSFWGIINNNLHGASLHWMTHKLDDGPIIDRIKFKDKNFYTADYVQAEANKKCILILKKNINKIMSGKAKSQKLMGGSFHLKKEIKDASTLSLKQYISVKKVFNLMRATKNKDNGFYIKDNKETYFIKIDKIKKI